jgi:hypothetical protein
MPGSRDSNLRGGDLCEGLGLELLRPFAFVAPVPRPEDVGVDAVATLIKRNGRQLLAEQSFLVQVKSSSVRAIEFREGSLDWLRSLALPFFLLSVDLTTTTLELRSIVNASSHPNYRDRKVVTLYLDETPFDLSGDRMGVWLGPPILRWTPAEAADSAFQATAHEILKTWIAFEMECISVRTLGVTLQVKWETNHKPDPTGTFAIMSHPDELRSVLEKMRLPMQWLVTHTFTNKEQVDDLLTGLLLLSGFMRRHGVEGDPTGVLSAIARLRLQAGDRNNKVVVSTGTAGDAP